jgi:hypothetical protein
MRNNGVMERKDNSQGGKIIKFLKFQFQELAENVCKV